MRILIKRILNIINDKNVITDDRWQSILKSARYRKKSRKYLLVLHFSKAKSVIQVWLEEQLKPKFGELLIKKIIDMKVYSPMYENVIVN
jgi:hypothetical protein